jgi:hypothetical protein
VTLSSVAGQVSGAGPQNTLELIACSRPIRRESCKQLEIQARSSGIELGCPGRRTAARRGLGTLFGRPFDGGGQRADKLCCHH